MTNLRKRIGLGELKINTENKVEMLNDMVKGAAKSVNAIINDIVIFANMEIDYAERCGIEDSQMSSVAQKLKRTPELQFCDGTSLLEFLNEESQECSKIPGLMFLAQDNNAENLGMGLGGNDDFPIVTQTEPIVTQTEPTKVKAKSKRFRPTLDLDEIDLGEGISISIKIKAPLQDRTK